MSIEVVDRTQGEVIQAGPMRLRILEDGQHTDHRLGLVEITIPPRIDGPPQHIHRQHDETFFVVSGTPTFTCGGETITAQPGTLVTAPPGTPHTRRADGGHAVHGHARPVRQLLPGSGRSAAGTDWARSPRGGRGDGALRHGGRPPRLKTSRTP